MKHEDPAILRAVLRAYLSTERRECGPLEFARLKTGWSKTRLDRALFALGAINESGVLTQGWIDAIEEQAR